MTEEDSILQLSGLFFVLFFDVNNIIYTISPVHSSTDMGPVERAEPAPLARASPRRLLRNDQSPSLSGDALPRADVPGAPEGMLQVK